MERKRVLITGVGTGIGKATCLHFLNQGWQVLGILRNTNHKSSLQESAGEGSNSLTLIYSDLESDSFVTEVQQQLSEFKIERLDVLINIAGVLDTKMIDETSLTRIEKVMRVNFVNPALLIAALKPLISKSKSSNIVNITSMSGYQGSVRFPGLSIYGASKAALGSLSESLACEFENSGIHINALAIGSVNTKMLQNAFPDFQASISPGQMASYIYQFASHGYQFHNGKVISVAITNP